MIIWIWIQNDMTEGE